MKTEIDKDKDKIMARIFISYKRVDKDKVFKIKDQIEAALGEKCWIDLDGIESDAVFASKIIGGINACKIFLFMYSKAHRKIVDYENDWTIRELNFAQMQNKRIVFINIDGSELTDWFRLLFGTKQQVNSMLSESMEHLIRDLAKWLSIKINDDIDDFLGTKTWVINYSSCIRLSITTIIILLVVYGGFLMCNNISVSSSDKDNHINKPISSNASSDVHAVDLGLSVKWANMNIGANSITDYGNYYAWGEICPQSNNQYDWESYKWAKDDHNSITKYCTNKKYGEIDNKTTLEPEDDAATFNWGRGWRMPTQEECQELSRKCYWVLVSSYNNTGVQGYIVYKAKNVLDEGIKIKKGETPSSKYSLSDVHIFLPAAGIYSSSFIKNCGTFGYYRSSSLNIAFCDAAYEFFFMPSGIIGLGMTNNRHQGCSVRAVCK